MEVMEALKKAAMEASVEASMEAHIYSRRSGYHAKIHGSSGSKRSFHGRSGIFQTQSKGCGSIFCSVEACMEASTWHFHGSFHY